MFRSWRYSVGNAMNVAELLQKLVLDAILIFEMLHLANVNSTNRFDSVDFCLDNGCRIEFSCSSALGS